MCPQKILFIANHKGFSKFNAPYMRWFKEQGWQVDNASPGIETGNVDMQYDICIERTPFSLNNIKAIFQLKRIIEREKYNIIHVHTPMGSVIGRLASLSAKKKYQTKIIYTAHGFHFFSGAPLLNWLVYYPIEKLLAKYTDILVTINNEDYQRAIFSKLSHGAIYQIAGVGVDLSRFHPISELDILKKRAELGLKPDDFVALYTAQFIHRKNHSFLIESLPYVLENVPNFKLIFAGSGETLEDCKKLANVLGVEKSICFLGARSDIPQLCGMSDIHISASKQEGLAINNIEAMATGCPLIISNIRGHRDVCVHGRNGYLYNLDNPQDFCYYIVKIAQNKKLQSEIGANNIKDAYKFSVEREVNEMAKIYNTVM